MDKRLKDRIEEALEELEEEKLKKFKRRLNEVEVEAGYSRIPRGSLQRADPMDVADSIVSYYRDGYGLRLTAQILLEINEKPLADRLLEAVGGGGGGEGTGGASESSMPPATKSEEKARALPTPTELHFVDRHRQEIIARTSLVAPILDRLLTPGLLTQEQNDDILSKDTSQNRMRALYRVVTGWGQAGKDRLYEALKKENGALIDKLGGQ